MRDRRTAKEVTIDLPGPPTQRLAVRPCHTRAERTDEVNKAARAVWRSGSDPFALTPPIPRSGEAIPCIAGTRLSDWGHDYVG